MSRPILIVGGNGFLGDALLAIGRRQGLPMYATMRHPLENSTHIQRLDLANPLDHWTPPENCQSAILCAANTSLEACRRDPHATRQINVTQTLRLAEKLLTAGVFVIFISSNAVFDGSRPSRRADEPTCPMTEYGRHKAVVEAALLAFGEAVAIVRLTKVVNSKWPLIRGWMETLRASQACPAFADYVCAPIPVEMTLRGLLRLAQQRLPGIWQFSADSDVSYLEIARHIAHRLKCDSSLVKAFSGREHAALEHIPQNTTLDTLRSRQELELVFPPPLDVIDHAFF